MTAPTHRYTGSGLVRADGEQLEPGDTCAPTEAELDAFGDSFTELTATETEAQSESEEPDADADADESAGDDGDESDSLTEGEARDLLDNAGFDPDDYTELSSAAADMPDVNGNLPADELRIALAEALAG